MRGLFRSTVVACLLAGVVLVSSGFAVVSGTVAKPGGVCSKAGARVVSQGVSLVCKKSGLGKLVWRVAKASTATTVVPTTTTATTTTTTTVALTCAAGGTCIVGNTGPGGGVVFYVSATNFTSTGSDCNTACKYLEAAPADQSAGIVWATTAAFCYNAGGTTSNNSCQERSIYSGDTTAQAASRTAATAIGIGMANTNQIYARVSNGGGAGGALTNTYAAGIAFAYDNNGKTDWHLPSKDELNQMCKWQSGVAWTSDATVCTGGTLNSGPGASGFSTGRYWSSSEFFFKFLVELAWYQYFLTGNTALQLKSYKSSTAYVRPVRAFG